MNLIPGTEEYEFDPELVKMKAEWLAWKYRLPYERVYKVLDKTVLKEPIYPFEYEPDEVEIEDLIYYMIFKPDLQEALTYLKPAVALKLFENEKPEAISAWMKQSSQLIGKYTKPANYLRDVTRARRKAKGD
jgi:hypothetical protein